MLESKEQKQLFAGALILIVLLGLVSFWRKPDFKYVDNADYSKSGLTTEQAKAYLDYLANVKTDPAASKQLFQEILTEEDVKKEVVAALKADQPPVVPRINEAKIKVGGNNNKDTVSNYLSQTVGKVSNFNAQTLDINKKLFDSNPDQLSQLKSDLNSLVSQVYDVRVPSDAVALQKSLLVALASYQEVVNASIQFNPNDLTQNDPIWPTVYNSYQVANDNATAYNNEFNRLADKYKISQIEIPKSYAKAAPFNPLAIPIAQAQFLSGTIIIHNLEATLWRALDDGFTSAFLHFMANMLNGIIKRIESNYAISNFLFYNDAVYNLYAQNYLDKNSTTSGLSPLDQQMIKAFIPQMSCGQQPPNMEDVLKAKAQAYLGFDPNNISLNDPDYYAKMSRVGNFLSSPSGWSLNYQNLAGVTQSAAQQSVNQELTSSGLKTPRLTSTTSIAKSINSIISAEASAFSGIFNLGTPNASSPIGSFVSATIQNLSNEFIFQGTTGGGGSIAVLKEQSLCTSAMLLAPVIGLADVPYTVPSTPITTEDAQAISCSYQTKPDPAQNCTLQPILDFLSKCVNTPSQTDPSSCSTVATSPFVNNFFATCPATIPVCNLFTCSQLQRNCSIVVNARKLIPH